MASSEDELIGIPFPEHSSDLLSSLNEQRHSGVLCDITIKTRGLEYPTHRAVLAACSDYFRKMFTGMPGRGKCPDVCQLDFLKPDALGALLDFAYTATLTISNGNMRDVLRAARLLEIPCVVHACVDILQCNGHREEMGGDAEDLECFLRARQYLDSYMENGENATPPPEAESPPPHPHNIPVPPKSVQIIPRRGRKKFLQVNPNRRNQNGNLLRGADDSLERDASHAGSPPNEPNLGYETYAQDNGLGGHTIFVPPSPPEEILSDEETSDMGFHNPYDLENPVSAGLDVSDKLVRKRRSQLPQECPVCHKIIHGAGKLPRHMRTHTGEKPFVCQVCGVRFTRNDKLKIHMRKHTGERPYCCEHCSARFLHSYDLKNHMHLHTGDRPFECSLCHKAFAKEDHLQRHMKGQNCLEVRTRRRRKEEPTVPHVHPALDLSNGKLEDVPLSMIRFWGIPVSRSGGGSPEGVLDAS
ncbi:zinc finger and BTB domain containing 7B L homeolog isoform X1 [Xenopus laevis]|uniref:Zbtb7b protein n=1 Tax=Xenopus laevis TaxID=8355 RepID=Q2VPN0_XENLA|nr:zinc finger and BTB domain containing 7B L homeolog [Xenopus laevis]XP_041428127.1 zinc finger and BTB domain containing 7B L homeolog isoform X1 [Xenopus laevis]XP_041428128.1 zinc finger and BTB domain containing 7B L homeolog isoform X1 [Xenopus laevis]XP_041428129.1 zinc finger and BTB domain containing 7B L homeolog isoform X1 [Xenopus laevis]AAI08514.1 Zbtb7b protein [Xenopus laevis]